MEGEDHERSERPRASAVRLRSDGGMVAKECRQFYRERPQGASRLRNPRRG
jgi:hypothetical protein